MTPNEAKRLAYTLKRQRQALGLSASEVARRAGVTAGTITRLELASIQRPQAETLKSIAEVLDIPVSDLFTTADWLPKHQLPTFSPYLRTKYRDLPPEALTELEQSFGRIAKRYGYDGDGPAPGEDEK